jgi:hypothetical protein
VPIGYIAACRRRPDGLRSLRITTRSRASFFTASVRLTFCRRRLSCRHRRDRAAEAFAAGRSYRSRSAAASARHGRAAGRQPQPDFSDRYTVVLLAAGFVGGFAYWLIAGRLAGTEPAAPDASPG